MLGRLGIWRHVVVALSVAACAIAALLGFLGGRGERFDAKQITVSPANAGAGGGDGVQIREVVDQDFGNARRHGYERIIPIDFGVPTNIQASSPDANADIGTEYVTEGLRIRLGDPDQEFTGQHRYVLQYVLPEAELTSGRLDLDIIGNDEDFETGRFEVVITGFVLSDTVCSVGDGGRKGGCELEARDDGTYRVVFEPLSNGDGVTVEGTIDGYTDVVDPRLPALPKRAVDNRAKVALAMLPLGFVAGLGVYLFNRRRGSNEVFAGGAAEAAFGRLPTPAEVAGSGGTAPAIETRLVADSNLDELATIEFVPPKGIDPWQGAVLLRERIDEDVVGAWFSALVAREAITIDDSAKKPVLGVGRRRSEVDPTTSGIIDQFFHGRPQVELGSYDPQFASAWGAVRVQQTAMIRASGWWRKRPPGSASGARSVLTLMLVIVLFIGFSIGATVLATVLGFANSIPVALAIGLVVPLIVAFGVYATLLPARSATGSALALQSESFRRFLAASEGKHVEWAWQQGLLREYSAWAVALGAADAWSRALAQSNVPPQALGYSNPLIVHSVAHSFSSSHTAPSSSSGGGSGGGGVGGGGGGGSSGSW